MNERREFLKLGLAAAAGAIVAPLEALAAAKAVAPSPAEDQKFVRKIVDDGWNGKRLKSPQWLAEAVADQGTCTRTFQRFNRAFPDLHVDVVSVERRGDVLHLRWSAQGTQTGPFDEMAPKGKRMNLQGSAQLKLLNGKVASSSINFDEAALKLQLAGNAH
ncbi:MAG: ester cyclase [Thermoanaerobaculia bacterium]|nr:ester cyclase [Thermoanaerobaculia bacterium]